MIGTTIGPYHVVSALGAGGMGEVYRAHDTRLQRDVALKVLPASVAQDPDRLARFDREAQVLASLNHPNIAQIYGLERAGDTTALVLELVEGPTLADRLAGGALPRSDAIAIARQIVDALEAAHENGIVHRDLKPANIKVRADDTVKVLDFGLAKALRPEATSGEGALTMTSPAMTQRGVILGTAAYMSPEQARGRTVDRRADIWAFGVVLYEMLTGERPFGGDDVTEVLASVIKDEVNWRRLPSDLPPALGRLLRRCLERDPKRRLSSIADARLELDEPLTAAAAPVGEALPSVRRRPGWLTWTVVVSTTALAAAIVLAAWANFRRNPAAPPPIRFSIDTPDASMDAYTEPYVSPDGRLIAFIAFKPQTTTNVIWIRPLDAVDARPLAGTEGADVLFWSADSRFIGFVAHGSLMKAEPDGRSVSVVGQLPAKDSYAGTWGHGVILVALIDGRLLRVADDGGELTDMFPAGKDGKYHAYNPHFLPDGRHFLYELPPDNPAATDGGGTFITSVDGGPSARVIPFPSVVVTALPGFLILTRDGHSFEAQRFDADGLRLVGDPIRIENEASLGMGYDSSVSATGVLVYRRANASLLKDLVWTDREGKVTGVAAEGRRFYQFRIAPDERRVAVVEIKPGGNELSVLDLTTHVASPLSVAYKNADDPAWSGDGASVGFESTTTPGVNNLFQERPGDARATPLLETDQLKYLDDWSRDGRYILFHTGDAAATLFALPLFGDRKPTLLIQAAEVDEAHFSPDGKWVAYQNTDSGLTEVWVAAFPAFDHRQRLSANGGCEPWWRGDGKELFYLSLDGHVMSVPVTNPAAGTIEFHAATALFQSPIRSPSRVIDEYGVTQDGNRFLFEQRRETTVQPIMVVVNWLRGIGR